MKKALRLIILLFIVIILVYTFIGIYRERKIKQEKSQLQNDILIENTVEKSETKERNLNLVPKEYKGYKVSANLKIKKLNIDTCVLSNYSKKAMETCITKFYGAEPNEVGNFCITGHNYITRNMFGYLYKLNIGDTFILTDNKHGVVEYKIYDKYTAEANETYRSYTKNKWQKRSYINNLLRLF